MEDINYDHINALEEKNWWYQAKRELFEKLLKGKKFEKALDIGCGVGSHFSVLQKFSSSVKGIDFSAKAVKYCKEKGLKNVEQGDVCNLQEKEKYDLVLCSELLEHVDDSKAVSEVANVMVKGGVFLFSVPAHMYLWNDNDDLSLHLRRYEKKQLKEVLEKHFIVEKLSYWNSTLFLPTYLFYKVQKLRKKREKTNNLNLVPGFLNGVLLTILRVENWLIQKINLPQGISLVGFCVKK